VSSSFAAVQVAFLRAAVRLAQRSDVARLMVVSDAPLPPGLIGRRSRVREKLIFGVTSRARRDELDAPAVVIPPFRLTRSDRLKLALLAAVADRLLAAGDPVLGLTSLTPRSKPDSMALVRVGAVGGEEVALGQALSRPAGQPEVIEAALDLALTVAAEGWEGHPVGTLIVVGDTARVIERSRQLALNPFWGYPERERNLLDPQVREAARAFATLDGAFVVRDDGVVVAAGRYLAPESTVEVPLGLGARHMAAAAVSAETDATCLAVSQTSGAVRVFRGGKVALELRPSRRL
jgi:diadenylate cyclase